MTAFGTVAEHGDCTYCGRRIALRADGTLRGHRPTPPGHRRIAPADRDARWCDGSNRVPAKVVGAK